MRIKYCFYYLHLIINTRERSVIHSRYFIIYSVLGKKKKKTHRLIVINKSSSPPMDEEGPSPLYSRCVHLYLRILSFRF